MKKGIFATGMMAFALVSAGHAQSAGSSSGDGDHYSQVQLEQLAHNAHTPDEYRILARSYSKQQSYFLQQAPEEKIEWQRRSQNIVSINAKYPRPVDSARYLYEYYVTKANEAGTLSAKYSQ